MRAYIPPQNCCCRKPSLLRLIVPGVLLALVPKCPLCLVAYAAWAGIGLSVTAAVVLRQGLVIACIAALVVVTASFLRRRSS